MKKALIKSASIISSATFLSRALGFLRDILIARTFGTGWFIQAFFVAFKIPNMLRELAAEGASNSAFVPVFSQYLNTRSRKEFWEFINTVFVAFIIITTCIALIGVLFSPFLIRLIAPGFIQTPEKLNLTVAINRPLFFYLLFVSIATFFMAVLNTFKSFFVPSFSPCIFNAVFIVAIIFADNSIGGIKKLIFGILIAGILQIIIQLPSVFKKGFKIRPFEFQKNIFGHPGVKLVGRLLAPRVIGVAIYDLNILIDTIFASLTFLVGKGCIAAIYYSSRLIQFPLGIFGHSIANASLPTLSEFAAKKDMDKFAETVEFSLTNILFVMVPSSLGLIILANPIIKIIFERGEFDSYSTMVTSTALAFYAIGLAAYGANRFLALCFNSLQNTVTPVKVSFLSLVINIILNVLFVIVFKAKIAGLAFASSISGIISAIIMFRSLRKRVGQLNSGHIINQTKKMLLAGLAMAVVILVTKQKLMQNLNPAIGLFITILLGISVYAIIGFYLKIYQSTNIFKWLLRKK
jgi:putative peptidoglycan lipid II flippase